MKIGNAHSNILKSLSQAENKEKTASFSDAILKIASEKPQSLKETLASISKTNSKLIKQAQMENMPPPAPEAHPSDMGTSPQPPQEDNGVEDAKKGLIDALIALCGGKEQAIQCIQDCCQDENPPELTDDAMGSPPVDGPPPAMNDAPTM